MRFGGIGMEDGQRWVDPKTAGIMLGFSDRKIRDLIRAGELPGRRFGQTYRVDLERFEAMLEESKPTPG